MNGLDWIFVAIIAVSGLIGVWRGFVRESVSLVTWILAFWVALAFAPNLAIILPDQLESPTLRWAASAIGLFMATLLVGGLANYLLGGLVDRTGLTGTDRSLGFVFGILRGGAIIVLCVLLLGRTTVAEEPFWEESFMRPWFEPMVIWVLERYPAEIAEPLIPD